MSEQAAASDRAAGATPPAGRARWLVLAGAVVGVLVVLVVVALAVRGDGVDPAPSVGEGQRAPGQALDWSDDLDHIGVSAEDFRRDWNRLVDEVGFGHELDPFTFPAQPYGMGAETQSFPDGAELEVIEHPEGYVSRMELRGEPADVDAAADYLGMVYALIHATSGTDRAETMAFAADELGIDETIDEADHTERARRDGVAYEFDTFHGQWRLWAGSSHDTGEP